MESSVKTRPLGFAVSRSSEDLPRGGQRAAFHVWNAAMLLLSSAGICVCTLVLGVGSFEIQLFYDYFTNPLVFFLNFLPILLFQLLMYALFNRQWIAFLTTCLVFVTAAAGCYYKIKFRTEPFTFADITMISAAMGVVSNYDLTPDLRIILCVCAVLFGTIFLLFFAKGRAGGKVRAAAAAFVLLALFPVWKLIYCNVSLYEQNTATIHIVEEWAQQKFVSRGFVYPFLYSIHENLPSPPDGYDKNAAAAELARFEDSDIPDDRRVNVIALQLESFADLTACGLEGVDEEAYSIIRALEDESFSGNLIVNVFAGGTVDTERGFLTGEYKYAAPTAPYPSFVRYFASQGYVTAANHPNYGYLYNRSNINSYLGFDEIRFSNNYYEALTENLPISPWFSDCVFMEDIYKQFKELNQDGQNVFSFDITMQGHGPYSESSYYYDTRFWDGSAYSSSTEHIVNNYLSMVYDTQQYLQKMVDELRSDEAPVVLLVYGDHKPWLGDNDSVIAELGLNFTPAEEAGFMNRYSTRYLMWANDAAKAALGNDFTGEGPTVSAGNLMSVLFDQLGWEGPAIMQFEREIRDTLPVVTSSGYYFENGSFTMTLSDKGKELFDLLTKIQYYYRNNYNK